MEQNLEAIKSNPFSPDEEIRTQRVEAIHLLFFTLCSLSELGV